MATGSAEHYIDPWHEYRTTSAKLKKRLFMRKPNLTEAAREFSHLALRLEDEECLSYCGLCHLAVARCENQNGSLSGEMTGLRKAARTFIAAHIECVNMGLPSVNKDLTSAIHCYGHAIKKHVECQQTSLAGCLCVELGCHLLSVDRAIEAVEYLNRAVKFLYEDKFSKANCLRLLANAYFMSGDYHKCLNSVDALWSVALICGKGTSSGAFGDLVKECEMATILIIMHIKSLPSELNERQKKVQFEYSDVHNLQLPKTTALTFEQYMMLKSMVLSVVEEDGEGADLALSQLQPLALCCKYGMDVGDDFDIQSNCQLVPLGEYPQLGDACIDVLNEEWPRSRYSRTLNLERSSNIDKLPVSLLLVVTDISQKMIVIGHARLCAIPARQGEAWLESVVVAKALRGAGLGRLLMNLTESFANQLNYNTIFLSTHDKHAFYVKYGYQDCPPVYNIGSSAKLLEGEKFKKLREGMAQSFMHSSTTKIESTVAYEKITVPDTKHSLVGAPPPPPPLPIVISKPQIVTQFMKKNI